MVGNFNDRSLDEIIKHPDRLGISTAFIVGYAVVAKYGDKVLPVCPVAVKIAAVILVFVGLLLNSGLTLVLGSVLQRWNLVV